MFDPRKQAQITSIKHEPSNKQLGGGDTDRTSFYAEIVTEAPQTFQKEEQQTIKPMLQNLLGECNLKISSTSLRQFSSLTFRLGIHCGFLKICSR